MKRYVLSRTAVAMTLMVLFVGCNEAEERYSLTIAGERLLVEIADTPETRATGLMHRKELDERHGMLFVFEENAPRTFWMKDTPLPLSIAYIDERWTIREIHDMEPLSLEPIPSRVPVRYALEVNQNTFARLGISVGARVVISDELRERISR